MLIFCDFIHVYVFTTNHHLKSCIFHSQIQRLAGFPWRHMLHDTDIIQRVNTTKYCALHKSGACNIM